MRKQSTNGQKMLRTKTLVTNGGDLSGAPEPGHCPSSLAPQAEPRLGSPLERGSAQSRTPSCCSDLHGKCHFVRLFAQNVSHFARFVRFHVQNMSLCTDYWRRPSRIDHPPTPFPIRTRARNRATLAAASISPSPHTRARDGNFQCPLSWLSPGLALMGASSPALISALMGASSTTLVPPPNCCHDHLQSCSYTQLPRPISHPPPRFLRGPGRTIPAPDAGMAGQPRPLDGRDRLKGIRWEGSAFGSDFSASSR